MQPLLYLAVRSFVNGIRRALTSGRRLVSLILVCGYWFWILIRPALINSSSPSDTAMRSFAQGHKLAVMPPLSYVETVVFWVFAGITALLMLGSQQRSMYRQADVDVLFPTPVNPKHVMMFRILRDYTTTLLVPLFFAIVGIRPVKLGFKYLIENFPDQTPIALRLMIISWLLLSAMWVFLHYAIGLWINRSDLAGDRNRKVLNGSFGIATLAVLGLAFATGYGHIENFDQFVTFTANPVFHVYFFGSTAATAIIMGPLHNNWLAVAEGAGAIIAIGAFGLWAAFRQVDWLYEQAAARAAGQVAKGRDMARRGDMMGAVAERARQGKVKVRQNRLTRWNAPGPLALVWRDLVIQMRTSSMLILMLLMTGFYIFIIYQLASTDEAGPVMLALAGLSVFAITMGHSQNHAFEMLKRVDCTKPMPFKPVTMALTEIVGASLLPNVFGIIPSVAVGVFSPKSWQWSLSGVIAVPTAGLVVCATVYVVTLLFPDIDDASQRGFRGLMTMLGVALSSAPGVLLMILLSFFHLPLVGAILWTGCNLGVSIALAALAGKLYMDYNPSE